MILALYLLLLAALLLFLNMHTRPGVAKVASYVGMWMAIGASVVNVIVEVIR